MSFFGVLVFAFIAWMAWRSVRAVQRSGNDRERQLALRGSIVLWMLAGLSVAALYVIPGRGRILVLIPMALILGGAAKAYFKSRRQLRESMDLNARLSRMKRVN